MLPSEWKRQKAAELAAQKTKVHRKISNNFIESAIKNSNLSALKTIFISLLNSEVLIIYKLEMVER